MTLETAQIWCRGDLLPECLTFDGQEFGATSTCLAFEPLRTPAGDFDGRRPHRDSGYGRTREACALSARRRVGTKGDRAKEGRIRPHADPVAFIRCEGQPGRQAALVHLRAASRITGLPSNVMPTGATTSLTVLPCFTTVIPSPPRSMRYIVALYHHLLSSRAKTDYPLALSKTCSVTLDSSRGCR